MPINKEALAVRDRRASILLVAEGDSWFDFPSRSDVITHLKRSGYAVKSVADHSHTLKFMATSEHQKAEFKELIERIAVRKTVPKAILLSGGGNDLVHLFDSLLNHFDPTKPTLNKAEVENFLNIRLRNDYLAWLDFITTTCSKTFQISTTVPILIHGYARTVPDGRGAFPKFGIGPWLKPVFSAKGYTSLEQNSRTMATLVNKFNDMLSTLPDEKKLNHVHYVDVRDELSNDLNEYKHDWDDELHPTVSGFKKVAKVFASVIDGFDSA